MPGCDLTADTRAPAAARRFVSTTLPELVSPLPDTLRDDAELVVSELVTNAVRSGSAVAAVELERKGRRISIAVRDESDGWPEPRQAGIHDVRGRGLPLVSAVSAAWGVRLTQQGKLVWAELDIPDS